MLTLIIDSITIGSIPESAKGTVSRETTTRRCSPKALESGLPLFIWWYNVILRGSKDCLRTSVYSPVPVIKFQKDWPERSHKRKWFLEKKLSNTYKGFVLLPWQSRFRFHIQAVFVGAVTIQLPPLIEIFFRIRNLHIYYWCHNPQTDMAEQLPLLILTPRANQSQHPLLWRPRMTITQTTERPYKIKSNSSRQT